MPSDTPISVAVLGAGVFGSHHARVYHELERQNQGVKLAGIVDSNLQRASAVGAEFGVPAFASVAELLAKVRIQAASVAVPTVQHLEVGRALLEAGVDVLVEKPVATTLEEVDELITVARRAGRIVQVGHLERFNPAVRAALPLVTHPMFFEVHRLSLFSPRSLDVDVVLDLMIHDLDVVLSFVDSPIKEIRAVGLPVLSAKVDIANVRMEFESGCVANFTASRVSTERVRKLRFFQPRQYISLDYSRQDVLVFSVESAAADELGATPPIFAPGAPQIRMSKPPVTPEEPLQAELKSFLQAVRDRSRPMVGLEEGRRALAAALEILEKIREHAARANLDALHQG